MTNNIEYESMVNTAIRAARKAGLHALEMIDTTQAAIKNNTEMVTEADRQCQDLIMEQIGQAFPEHGFIGEEGDQGQLFKRPPVDPDGIWWVIDPIDGTNNYAHGLPHFCVSIGAMHRGVPVAGVIYDPCTDHLYSATAGSPAKDNDRPITVSGEILNKYSSIGIDSHFGESIPDWATTIMTRTRFRNIGTTALHLAYVARGGLAGMVLFTPKLWDIAAGCLIVERAGGYVSDWQGNALWPMDLNTYEGGVLPGIMGNPVAHRELLDMINPT